MGALKLLSRMATAAVVALIAGCGGGGPAAPGQAQGPASQPAAAQPTGVPSDGVPSSAGALKTISMRISNDKVDGAPSRVEVNRGEGIRIEVTSDRSDEVHVHGYNQQLTLSPGKTGTLQFVADVPGEFEVETHRSGLLLFHLVVRG